MVGCVYYEAPDAIALIDPLVPPADTPDHHRFWAALDRDVDRLGRPVAVLLSSDWHERSAQAVYDRYRARVAVTVWAHEAAWSRAGCRLTDTVREGEPLPGGVQPHAIGIPYPSEVAYYLPTHRALVCGDCLIGAGGGRAQVAPAWWVAKQPEAQARYRTDFRPSLRRLLDLPIDALLTSHGPPVLQDGHRALAAALDAPAWGE